VCGSGWGSRAIRLAASATTAPTAEATALAGSGAWRGPRLSTTPRRPHRWRPAPREHRHHRQRAGRAPRHDRGDAAERHHRAGQLERDEPFEPGGAREQCGRERMVAYSTPPAGGHHQLRPVEQRHAETHVEESVGGRRAQRRATRQGLAERRGDGGQQQRGEHQRSATAHSGGARRSRSRSPGTCCPRSGCSRRRRPGVALRGAAGGCPEVLPVGWARPRGRAQASASAPSVTRAGRMHDGRAADAAPPGAEGQDQCDASAASSSSIARRLAGSMAGYSGTTSRP